MNYFDFDQLLGILLVVLVWLLAMHLIRNYGIGYGARSVVCPHQGHRATISTFWITNDGASRCDVLQCSLIPGGKPVTCDKGCLTQL